MKRLIAAAFLFAAIMGLVALFTKLPAHPVTTARVPSLLLLAAGVLVTLFTAWRVHRGEPASWRWSWAMPIVAALFLLWANVLLFAPVAAPVPLDGNSWSAHCALADPTPYLSERLSVLSECAEAVGTVRAVNVNLLDGDKNVCLVLDQQSMSMMNRANVESYEGCFMVEIMPAEWLSHEVPVPSVGQHVVVVGRYVTDTLHGWNEIHPATATWTL